MNFLKIAVLLSALTLATVAQGPESRRGSRDPLAAVLDRDHNGELSAGEILGAPNRLRELDRDGNGVVEEEEIREGAKRKRPKREDSEFDSEAFMDRVLKHDLDGDGLVTREELPAGLVRLLDQADADKNDAISKAELEDTMKRLRERIRGH